MLSVLANLWFLYCSYLVIGLAILLQCPLLFASRWQDYVLCNLIPRKFINSRLGLDVLCFILSEKEKSCFPSVLHRSRSLYTCVYVYVSIYVDIHTHHQQCILVNHFLGKNPYYPLRFGLLALYVPFVYKYNSCCILKIITRIEKYHLWLFQHFSCKSTK